MRGQAFSVLKILMGAVFAAALLLIVINVSESITPQPSTLRDLDSLVSNALSARGQCIKRDIMYTEGEVYREGSFTGSQDITFRACAPYGEVFSGSGTGELSALHSTLVPTSVRCAEGGACTIFVGSDSCSCP